MRARPRTRRSHGATLPIALLLLMAATLSALAALRSASGETQLTGTLLAAHRAFALAERGITLGLATARTDPARLPTVAPLLLPSLDIAGMGRADIVIQPGPVDDHCPALAPLPAERRHFEIHATALVTGAIRTTHVQGFFICRELCTAADCIAAELPPVRSYWHARPGAAP